MLLAGLAGCGGQDATTLTSTTGAQEPASPEPAAASNVTTEPSAPELTQSEHIKTQREPDGSFASEVNATSMQSWVYFSLQSQQEVTPDPPEQSPSWDPVTHVLSARDTVFVVKTPGGAFKLQFASYYDAAGTPGMPQFRWAKLGGS